MAGATKLKIEIVAELNGKSKEEITEILVRGGEIIPGKIKKQIKPYPKGFEKLMDMVDNGELTITSASLQLGIKPSMFRYYAGRLHNERTENEQIQAAADSVAAEELHKRKQAAG